MQESTTPTKVRTDAEVAAMIAAQNDAFRVSALGGVPQTEPPRGKVVMTQAISQQSEQFRHELIGKVRTYTDFNEGCDPHGWHEMGVVEVSDETVWFKFDLYDQNYEMGSETPEDPAKTYRVLTLLFPSDY